MKKLLATLNLYVDLDPAPQDVSGLRGDGRNFDLTMYPYQQGAPCENRHEFQTILAHELGHFVGIVTRDPSHGQRVQQNKVMAIRAGDDRAFD